MAIGIPIQEIRRIRREAKEEVFDDIEKLPSFSLTDCVSTTSIIKIKKKHLEE